jgi:hypothetical protein
MTETQADSSDGYGSTLELADAGSAALSVPAMKPGQSGTLCQTVTYRGRQGAFVRLYSQDGRATRGMGTALQIRVDAGTGRVDARSCLGFRPTQLLFTGPLSTFPASWQTSSPLPVSGGDQIDYRITYTLALATGNSAQGGSAGMRLVWEARGSGA